MLLEYFHHHSAVISLHLDDSPLRRPARAAPRTQRLRDLLDACGMPRQVLYDRDDLPASPLALEAHADRTRRGDRQTRRGVGPRGTHAVASGPA